MKLSDYVARFISNLGVRHVFMLPGGGSMHLVDSIGHCENLEYVCTLHEQACAVAAEAYARVGDNLGVALVTTGPGGTNAITGVAAAWLDSTACLFISGQVKRPDLMQGLGVRQHGLQEIDIVSIVKPITKYAVTITEPRLIRYHLEKAVHLARSERKGPVWIDIPLDVQAATINPDELERFRPAAVEQPADLKEKIGEAIQLLNESVRPVILAGNGVRLAGAKNELLKLVELLEIPILTTRLGVDLVSSSHELNMGMPGSIAARSANFTLQNSDYLLVIGARLDMSLTAYGNDKFARSAKKVMVNIDPAEIAKMRTQIHVPVCADAKSFIDEFLEQKAQLQKVDRGDWIRRCNGWRQKYPFVLEEHRTRSEISMYFFSEVLCDQLCAEDVILPGSSGFACEIFLTAFKVKNGQRVFHNKGTGAMGLSQPAAIGACLGSGLRRTISVDGDGGFQMNIQELETIRRLNLPVKFFVINNNGYASIRSSQSGYFGRLTGADPSSGQTFPDVVKVADAYGINTARISHPLKLRDQIREVLDFNGPIVCEVSVIADEPRQPRVASFQKPDGSMISKPLEDMWPFLDREEFHSNMIVPPVED